MAPAFRAIIALLFSSGAALTAHQAAAESRAPRLAVMDIALTGDTGGPELTEQHAARARMASDRLRAALARTRLYEIADNAPALDTITRLESVQYLHKCNGCELDIAQQLGASHVLVAWVYRVSSLILTLNYEIRDVPSGTVAARSSFSFRGDNDAAWSRAVEYLVRDLEERSARLYDVTIETGMPHLEENLRYTVRREQRCLAPAEIFSMFPALSHASLADCRLTDARRDGDQSSWTLACTGGRGTTGRATWRFDAPPIIGRLDVKLGGKNMTFNERIALKPLGSCQAANADARVSTIG